MGSLCFNQGITPSEITVDQENPKEKKRMYDATFSCDSLKNLYDPKKGWKYFMTDKFKTRLSKEKKKTEDNFCPICIIGDSNKGKTLLQIY